MNVTQLDTKSYLNSPTSISFAEICNESVRLVASLFGNNLDVANLAKTVEQHHQISFNQVGGNVADENSIRYQTALHVGNCWIGG